MTNNRKAWQMAPPKMFDSTMPVVAAAILGLFGAWWLSENLEFLPASLLLIGIVTSVLLNVRVQVLLFLGLLPLTGLLKRLVFLDPRASIEAMYLVLGMPDLLLAIILTKVSYLIIKRILKPRWGKADLMVAGFFGISSLSVLLSRGVPAVAKLATWEMCVLPMFFYLVGATLLSEIGLAWKFRQLVTRLGIVVAIYGIQQFLLGFWPFEQRWLKSVSGSSAIFHIQYAMEKYGFFRVFSTMDSHTDYGIFVGMALVLFLGIRRRTTPLMTAMVSVILGFSLLLSFSRTMWLMPVTFGICCFALSGRMIKPLLDLRRLRQPILWILALVLSYFIVVVILANLYGKQLVQTSNPWLLRVLETGTLAARLRGMSLLSQGRVTLFGQGLATTGFIAQKFELQTQYVGTHNIFLEILELLGVVGVFCFILLLLFLLKRSFLLIDDSDNPWYKRYRIVLTALVVALVLVGHFSGPVFYWGKTLPYYFWGLCGMIGHLREAHAKNLRTSPATGGENG